jgi:hypothetical protein
MITPTAMSAMLAGAVLWCMIWMAVNHVDEIPYVRDYISLDQIKDWIAKHPTLAILLTEAVNLMLHGISSPAAMAFNLGGTVINAAVIYGVIPSQNIFSFGLTKLKEAKVSFEDRMKKSVASVRREAA